MYWNQKEKNRQNPPQMPDIEESLKFALPQLYAEYDIQGID